MNLTFSVDERVVERARRVARSMDKSLNQLVREYLEQLAGRDQVDADCAELRRLSAEGPGRSDGGASTAASCMSGRSFLDADS